VGRVRIPSVRFVVMVRAEGYREEELGPWSPDSVPASVEVTLTAHAGIRGRLTGPGAAGARLVVHELARDDQVIVDLVNIRDKEQLPGTYMGACW